MTEQKAAFFERTRTAIKFWFWFFLGAALLSGDLSATSHTSSGRVFWLFFLFVDTWNAATRGERLWGNCP